MIPAALDDAILDELRAEEPAPQTVYHLGGSGSVGAAAADPSGDFSRTVESTRRLVRHMKSMPNARLVLVSSAAVYGDCNADRIAEDTPLRPISVYGENKAAAESHALESQVPISVVRFFSVFGAGLRKQLLWDASQRLRTGERDFGGTGDEVRDWLHVDDAVALLELAGDATERVIVMNGGSGVGTRVAEVLVTLAAALGVEVAPRFSGQCRQGDPQRLVAAIDRARSLGWVPRRSLHAGIAEYARWFELQP